MSSGELRHKIEVQQFQSTVSSNGDVNNINWLTYKSVWASVKPMDSSAQREESGQRDIVHDRYNIKIRFDDGVTTNMRILHKGDSYDIEAIHDLNGRKQYLTLRCMRNGS